MKIVNLPVEKREALGSANARRLRRAGRLPVNLYGMGRAATNLTIDAHHFGLVFERGSRMFELQLGDDTQVCLLKDVQYDALGDGLMHADFWRVDDSKPVTINVALEFVGVPEQVSGAVVDYVTREVHISCIPRSIPRHLEVPVAHLHVGHHIQAGELELPEGAELMDPPETTLVSFHFKHGGGAEDADAVEEGEGDASVEPEVITERKSDDGDSDG